MIARRDTVVLLKAGLRTYEWVLTRNLRLPVQYKHSGFVQILDSFTVAGAVPEWFLRTHRLPVSPQRKNPMGNLK